MLTALHLSTGDIVVSGSEYSVTTIGVTEIVNLRKKTLCPQAHQARAIAGLLAEGLLMPFAQPADNPA